MVELVEVLHVAEDDVLLVDNPWWDLLYTTGHLPQVRLETRKKRTTVSIQRSDIFVVLVDNLMRIVNKNVR